MINEKGVVRRAKEGDERAFELLVTAYEKKVYSMAYRFSGNEQNALDITQEVFLRVFRSIGGFKEESSFSTWLYRITSNICIDYARKATNNVVSLSIENEMEKENKEIDLPDNRYNPESAYHKKELRQAIADAILLLTPEHRQILIMRDINGLSYAEIAEILKLETGTVKSRIARARDNLRSILQKEGNFFANNKSKSCERGRIV